MFARVWRVTILPGKMDDFLAFTNGILPILQRHRGFCGMLALRSGPGERLEVTVLSMWTSLEALQDSETPEYREALVKFLALCEHRPFMREEEVMMSEFPSKDPDDTVTRF
jgi:heme-degrading monooxygenase HmoA